MSGELEVRPDGELAPVLDGELVVDEPVRPAPRTLVGRVIRRPVHIVTTLRRSHRARVAAALVVRLVWLTAQGHVSWLRRAGSAMTHGTYRAAIRAAEAGGDREALAEWVDRLQKAKNDRSKRLRELPGAVFAVVRVTVFAGFVGLVLAVAVGAGIQFTPGGWHWSDWWGALAWLVTTVGAVLYVLAVAALWAAGPVELLVAYREGVRSSSPPRWVAVALGSAEEGIVVTPAGIAAALAHLGVAPLSRAIKDGWTVDFLTPPVRVNGRGYAATFSLPLGVTVGMLADRREVLARNLSRAVLEVWVAESERAGHVDLWVADPGAAERPAPEYPLLHEGRADVFEGIPLGVSQRGDVIAPPLVGANVVVGGLMGQGKSNAGRVLMLGAALDPLCELWVYVFAGNGDYDAYAPRLARYHRGTGPDVTAAALDGLRTLYGEVDRREARLAELGAKKVTRSLVAQYPDLRPVVAMFSECHELFGSEHGAEAADLAVQTLRRARKTGIVLGFDTQSSRADAIPPKVVELAKLAACFAVRTWRSNDGFLGDGSFAAGIRATELRPGKDVGTSILTGATAERFELLKWYFVEVDDDRGYDAAADVIARATAKVHPGVRVGGTGSTPAEPAPVERNLLADLDEVLGIEPVRAPDAASLLKTLAPRWAPYRNLTGKALAERLAAEGVKVPRTGNVARVDPAAVRAVLATRSTADLDAIGAGE